MMLKDIPVRMSNVSMNKKLSFTLPIIRQLLLKSDLCCYLIVCLSMGYAPIAHTHTVVENVVDWILWAHFLISAVFSDVIESCCACILLTIVETECHVLI